MTWLADLKEAKDRVSSDLFDFLADIDIGEQTLGDLSWLTEATAAVLESKEKWWCETHDAEGVPMEWMSLESTECWRCIYTDIDIDPDTGLCRMVRRRLLAEKET